MPDSLDSVRQVCLVFPEAVERETWGHPTFRVKDKIFASFGHDDAGRPSITMKTHPGEQEALLAEGEPYFYPAYVGPKGWIGVNLDKATDWEEIAELVEESYRLIAPKRLVEVLDED